jgi:hypothetical protein
MLPSESDEVLAKDRSLTETEILQLAATGLAWQGSMARAQGDAYLDCVRMRTSTPASPDDL